LSYLKIINSHFKSGIPWFGMLMALLDEQKLKVRFAATMTLQICVLAIIFKREYMC